jgi:cobalt-zinc-cadmium efflux system protein
VRESIVSLSATPGGDERAHDARRVTIALVATCSVVVAEVVAALVAHSTALLADAGHMVTDVAALAVSLWTMRLSLRPPRGSYTFGYRRSEVLSAALNGVALAVVAALVVVESITRLAHPVRVDGGLVLAVALAGAAVNAVARAVLAPSRDHGINLRAAIGHIETDLYAFLATAVAAVVVLTTNFYRADAIASLCVVVLIARTAWSVMRDAGRILLQAAPSELDLDAVRAHLAHVDHVRDVHDLHAWTLSSGSATLSAHVVVESHCFDHGHTPALLDELQACLATHFDIHHATLQLEPDTHASHEDDLHA